MADNYNSVPLGQAGTGAAYLLGGSRALDRWMQREDENVQIRKYNSQQKQKQQQIANKNMSDNDIKGVVGKRWNTELNGAVDAWRKKGAQYMSQKFDPFNPDYSDPNQVALSTEFVQEKAKIEQMMAAQKNFSDVYMKEVNKSYSENPYDFEQDSVINPDKFEQENSLYDLSQGKVELPQLRKVFDVKKEIYDAIPAMSASNERIQKNNDGSYSKVNETKVDFDKLGKYVDGYLTGGGKVTNYIEKKIGGSISGLLKTTDKKILREKLMNEFLSPTENNPIVELMSKGKIPSVDSPEFEKFLDYATEEQHKVELIYDQEKSKAIQAGAGKVDPKYSNLPYFDFKNQQRADEDQARQGRNEQRAIKKDGESNTPITVRELRIDNIFKGDSLEMDKLQGEVLANPKYGQKPLSIDTYKDGTGRMIFHVPNKIKTSEFDVAVPAYDVMIDPRLVQHKNKLNKLISDVTGENVASGNYEGVKGNKNNSGKTQTSQPKQKSSKPNTFKSKGGISFTVE